MPDRRARFARKPLPPDERHRILVDWNATDSSFPSRLCIHELFELQVSATPDADAVVDRGRRWSYSELDRQANCIARALTALGVGSETPVGIWMYRTPEMIAALLAVLKAGGTYVPLDPTYPPERIAYKLKQCGASVVLTQESLRDSLPDSGAQLLSVESVDQCSSSDAPTIRHASQNLAYLLYTSGSTGLPKSVAIEHRSVVALLSWAGKIFSAEERAGVLASTSICFDLSVFEIFFPLSFGGKVILADNALQISQLSQADEVTLINTVPSAIRELVRSDAVPSTVRTICLAGEALSPALVDEIYDRTDVAKVYDLYGPSEDTTYSTFALRRRGGPNTIGRPIANTQLYLLDEAREPVAPGEVGEIYLGGAGLARGYYREPEMTKRAFVSNPFDDEAGSRLYRTGDLARADDEGNFEFIGRADHQLKIRGFRIEPGEIENVLESMDEIDRAIVLARADNAGSVKLVAYWLPAVPVSLSDDALRETIGRKCPVYMIPSRFVRLARLPLTPNGKLDRSKLPDPWQESGEPTATLPATPLETKIANLWKEVLQLKQVDIDHEFFDLGGDSLQAARVLNRLQGELGEPLFIAAMFEYPTVREFAAMLERDYAESLSSLSEPSSESSPGVDLAAIEVFEEVIPRLSAENAIRSVRRRNPPALFILAPPRSGTTLMRVMLAGNPGLFASAELQLLGFQTLADRREAYQGKFALWLEGTIRALMEIDDCDAESAKRTMEVYERRNYTTHAFYHRLQQWIGDRMLVDKSPSYALDPGTLNKAESDFDGAYYVQLVRHPYSMVRSFEKHHLEQALYLYRHEFSSRQLAELVWLVSHRNICDFFEQIPAERQLRLRFEDLVQEPESAMRALCKRIGLEFHPDMVNPYKDLDRKMVDGIHAESMPMGDTKFLARKSIEAEAAASADDVAGDDFLGDACWSLAERLGYRRP